MVIGVKVLVLLRGASQARPLQEQNTLPSEPKKIKERIIGDDLMPGTSHLPSLGVTICSRKTLR